MRPDAASRSEVAAGHDPVAIICGGGSFPIAVAEAAVRRGRQPVMFGIRGWADAAVVERYPHHWIALGQVGRFFSLAKAEHCRDVLFIGAVLRPPLSQIRLDWLTLRLLPGALGHFRGGDDRLLFGLASIIERHGFRVIGLDDIAPEIFVADGALGRHQPSDRDRADIARAMAVIGALGPYDIGQAVVVADNHVLAVEAAEGTDNLLLRIAELRRQGRVAAPPARGVLVKAPKPGQDRRFDLPSIGPRTIANVAQAGLAGVAVAAGSTIIAEPALTIAAADRANIFFAGVRDEAAR
jgi:hypothetical protein